MHEGLNTFKLPEFHESDNPAGMRWLWRRRWRCCLKPKFHLARHVTCRHDTTRSTYRAHACCLCRTERLDTTSSTGLTRRTCHVETWRAKWNSGLTCAMQAMLRQVFNLTHC